MFSIGTSSGCFCEVPPRCPVHGLVCSALVFVSAACLMRPIPLGYLMMRTALFLTCNPASVP